jgi:hypothetical protein
MDEPDNITGLVTELLMLREENKNLKKAIELLKVTAYKSLGSLETLSKSPETWIEIVKLQRNLKSTINNLTKDIS